jgi:uncharacterized protein (TIGR00255 family)
MPLSSMTGFARDSATQGTLDWTWEIKSVNGKALDIRLRLPAGFEHIEVPARQAIAAACKRGNLQVNLALQAQAAAEKIAVNRDVLNSYVAIAEDLRAQLGAAAPSVDGLLSLKGVIELKGEMRGEAEQAALDAAIVASLNRAVAALTQNRRAEGQHLQALISGQLQQIESLHAAATANPARQPEAIRAKLRAQVAELAGETGLDEQRLYQEAVLLATKADVKEELDRLSVHIAAARDLVKSSEPVGRKFDFLAQEFNREANTLCSKANDSSLTAIGLDLKTVIDQMREQVQNIE